jgi:predicted ABC-type ATPase
MRSLKEAKKIAAEFIVTTLESLLDNALQNNEDFVYEGHFPSYATWDFPKRFKDNVYQLQMLFLGLKDADLSEMRVGLRAKKGGHNVPRYDIENNFYGNLEMLNEHYHLLDHLQIVDTSVFLPKPLAAYRGTELISSVRKKELPEWFTRHLSLLADKIVK